MPYFKIKILTYAGLVDILMDPLLNIALLENIIFKKRLLIQEKQLEINYLYIYIYTIKNTYWKKN